jgi:hypothetical protein
VYLMLLSGLPRRSKSLRCNRASDWVNISIWAALRTPTHRISMHRSCCEVAWDVWIRAKSKIAGRPIRRWHWEFDWHDPWLIYDWTFGSVIDIMIIIPRSRPLRRLRRRLPVRMSIALNLWPWCWGYERRHS